VTYKDRLSRVGSNKNSEYGPIQTVSVPGVPQGSAPVLKTVETHEGVVFIPRPPDLRREPAREEWREEKVGGAAKACRKALTIRHKSDLSKEACREWKVLGSFHERYTMASSVPNMPHTEKVQGDATTKEFLENGEAAERTFEGTPQALLPLLKRVCFRFPRPLITWNIFSEEAPTSFPTAGSSDGDSNSRSREEGGSTEALRDPRKVNNVVHKGQTVGQWKKGQQELEAEGYVKDSLGVLNEEDLEEGQLYVVELDTPDGEFNLGLVQLGPVAGEGMHTVYWFERVGNSHAWPSRVKFKRYADTDDNWLSDDVPADSFLLSVEDSDLTNSSAEVRSANPTFCGRFVDKIRLFANSYGYSHENPKARRKAPAPEDSNNKPAAKRSRTHTAPKPAQRPRRAR
jgi:hypothetical protein